MACSSSYSPLTWNDNVFLSGRDDTIAHLCKKISNNGMTGLDSIVNEEIERGETITPAIKQTIRESRISIVLLTKNYASSRRCLDELLEMLKCEKAGIQKVIPIFFRIARSDVRKQTGDFGKFFEETCAHYGEEEKLRWSQALTELCKIAREHFLWQDEPGMHVKIATDVQKQTEDFRKVCFERERPVLP